MPSRFLLRSHRRLLSTNYAITGSGNSFERRKWELELTQHYTKDYTPLHEFGKLMFGDWEMMSGVGLITT